jgi:hypothetical protein
MGKLNGGFLKRFFGRKATKQAIAPPPAPVAAPPRPQAAPAVSVDDGPEEDTELIPIVYMSSMSSDGTGDGFDDDDDYNICGYHFVRKLGSGASGEVIHMVKDGRDFAVKICEIKRAQPRFLKASTHDPQEEAVMLRNLNHPTL